MKIMSQRLITAFIICLFFIALQVGLFLKYVYEKIRMIYISFWRNTDCVEKLLIIIVVICISLIPRMAYLMMIIVCND